MRTVERRVRFCWYCKRLPYGELFDNRRAGAVAPHCAVLRLEKARNGGDSPTSQDLPCQGIATSPKPTGTLQPQMHFLAITIVNAKEYYMNGIIWIVGAIVIVLFILSFLGLR